MAGRLASRGRAFVRRFVRPRQPEHLPIVLDRHRIYVLPTRFGLFFAALLATMAGGALNYNNNPALLLALLLGGAALASLIAAQLQLAGLRITSIEAPPAPAGSPLRVRVHVQGDRQRPRRGLRLEVVDRAQPPAVLDLQAGAGQAELALPTQRRGWLDLPRLRLSTLRPLGLARAWSELWPDEPLLVYPTPEPVGPPLPQGAGEHAQSRLQPSGDDIHHLRAYRHGDPLRTIAWKQSARRDTLLVREYEQPLGTEVVLDWRQAGALDYEARISRLARWVDEAERDGRRYRLVLPGVPPLGPDQGPAHRHACLRTLALMPDVGG